MTSLVVHFCSAPLVCFVDALDKFDFWMGFSEEVDAVNSSGNRPPLAIRTPPLIWGL